MGISIKYNWKTRAPQIRRGHAEFFRNIHKDAIIFLQDRLLSRVIGGQYVGVISGNLRRSQVIDFGEYTSEMRPNFTIAPYAGYVANWAFHKYGRDYYKILVDLYGKFVVQKIEKEFNRMIDLLNEGKRYKYKNPFPG